MEVFKFGRKEWLKVNKTSKEEIIKRIGHLNSGKFHFRGRATNKGLTLIGTGNFGSGVWPNPFWPHLNSEKGIKGLFLTTLNNPINPKKGSTNNPSFGAHKGAKG